MPKTKLPKRKIREKNCRRVKIPKDKNSEREKKRKGKIAKKKAKG